MLKKDLTIWDSIAWATLAGIALWVVLKAFGIINTPMLLEYSPVFGAVYLAGWAMHKLDRAAGDIKELKSNVKEMEKDVGSMKTEIALIRKNCPC